VVRWALAGAVVALCLPARAGADFAETTAVFTVRPGPLALYGVPVARAFVPPIRYTSEGPCATLPPIRVVDGTGSGRGWHLAVSVVSGGGAWIRTAALAYNGPARLRPHTTGEVQLAHRPRTIAYSLRNQGMGITVLRGASIYAGPGVRVRFALLPGP
jgi:hypothetical protein